MSKRAGDGCDLVTRQILRLRSVAPVFKEMVDTGLYDENKLLREKICKMEIENFLAKYSCDYLSVSLAQMNLIPTCRCFCMECALASRSVESHYLQNCRLKTWFEIKLREFGITFSSPTRDEVLKYYQDTKFVADLDQDVHLLNTQNGSWFVIKFGNKIKNAKSVDDPELKKLEKLFYCMDIRHRLDE